MRKQVNKFAYGLLVASLLGGSASSEAAVHPLLRSKPAPKNSVREQPAQAPGRPGGLRPASPELAVATMRRPSVRPSMPAAAPEAAPTLAMSALYRRIQSGRIIDEAGQPLVGATVLLKGTNRGTSTDANGDYALPVPLGTNTFVFAYAGYQDEVAQARDGQPLVVTLLPTADRPVVAPAVPTKASCRK